MDLAEDLQPHGSRPSRWRGTLASLVALTAIGLAVWEGVENRAHNRLTVMPRVDAGVRSFGSDSVQGGSLEFSSTGLGPAVITEFRIYLDGEVTYDVRKGGTPWAAEFAALRGQGWGFSTNAFGLGSLLRAGEDYPVFEATRRTTRDEAGAEGPAGTRGPIDRITVALCYCSVYGDACTRAISGTASLGDLQCDAKGRFTQ